MTVRGAMNNIISLSGGKDSTAMLLMMLERNEPIHSVAWFDTGWEFPEMHNHIEKLEKYSGVRIWTLRPRIPFEYWMLQRPIIGRKGANKGVWHQTGQGWPHHQRRWCTGLKIDTLSYYHNSIPDAVTCIGFTSDERHRTGKKSELKTKKRYPLIEWNITEADALKYCYDHGFDWGGLYELFSRVSCFCCPLQKVDDLRKIRKLYPILWLKMLDMDARQPKQNEGFLHKATVHDLDRRFDLEERQMEF